MDSEWLNISCRFYTFTKFDGISTHITNHNRCGMDLHVQTCCWTSKVVKNEERTKNLQSVNLKRNDKKMCYLPLLCDWHILFHSLLLIQSTTYLTYVLYNCIKTTGTHCTNTTTNTTIYLLQWWSVTKYNYFVTVLKYIFQVSVLYWSSFILSNFYFYFTTFQSIRSYFLLHYIS